MRPIPKKMRIEMNADPFYHKCVCAGNDFGCLGKIEWHHPWTYGGPQIIDKWATVPACEYHHTGPGFDKEYLEWISINRATPEDLAKYPKVDWLQIKHYLNNKFGIYAENKIRNS